VIQAGVLGSPISHSLSPILHRTAYAALGVKAEYRAYEVSSGNLMKFIKEDGKNLNCLSLTMPLKEEALEIAPHVSDIALQISSGNTLYKKDDVWHLTSTDVEGFSYALAAHQRSASGKVLIIGAGATARAVVAACNATCETLTVVTRSKSREDSIVKAAAGMSVDFVDWGSETSMDSFNLVVNTTPGDSAAKFANSVMAPQGILFELIYNPWPTQLLASWKKSGGSTIDGLELLIHQAISQIEIFASQTVNRAELAAMMRIEGLKALQ
jgi:shikimate dehydrogenase